MINISLSYTLQELDRDKNNDRTVSVVCTSLGEYTGLLVDFSESIEALSFNRTYSFTSMYTLVLYSDDDYLELSIIVVDIHDLASLNASVILGLFVLSSLYALLRLAEIPDML